MKKFLFIYIFACLASFTNIYSACYGICNEDGDYPVKILISCPDQFFYTTVKSLNNVWQTVNGTCSQCSVNYEYDDGNHLRQLPNICDEALCTVWHLSIKSTIPTVAASGKEACYYESHKYAESPKWLQYLPISFSALAGLAIVGLVIRNRCQQRAR